jgi:hypothetical protein
MMVFWERLFSSIFLFSVTFIAGTQCNAMDCNAEQIFTGTQCNAMDSEVDCEKLIRAAHDEWKRTVGRTDCSRELAAQKLFDVVRGVYVSEGIEEAKKNKALSRALFTFWRYAIQFDDGGVSNDTAQLLFKIAGLLEEGTFDAQMLAIEFYIDVSFFTSDPEVKRDVSYNLLPRVVKKLRNCEDSWFHEMRACAVIKDFGDPEVGETMRENAELKCGAACEAFARKKQVSTNVI